MREPSWNSVQVEQAARKLGLKVSRSDWLRLQVAGTTWFETRSPNTTRKAVEACKDKHSTRTRLTSAGVPAPAGARCRPHEAPTVASELGWPVCVKPHNGSKGRAVTAGITATPELVSAVRLATRRGGDVNVERSIDGIHYRCLVAGETLSTIECQPWRATGDGKTTVADLIAAENVRRRPIFRAFQIQTGPTLKAVLAKQGLTVGSVPAKGRKVDIATSMNLRQGAISVEATSTAPDRVGATAKAAVDAIPGLYHAAVDLVDDGETCWVVDVNSNPGLGAHLHPYEGTAPDGVMETMVGRHYL